MLIHSEFKIQFHLPFKTPMVALLHLHPSLEPRLRSGNELLVEHLVSADPAENVVVPTTGYFDAFGNRCTRFVAPAGHVNLSGLQHHHRCRVHARSRLHRRPADAD